MYCEGRFRPTFRGVVHILGVLIFIPIWIKFALPFANTYSEAIAFLIFFCGLTWCWLISSCFHFLTWNLKNEILLQKLDHSGVFICIFCLNLPMAFFLYGRMSSIIIILFTLICGFMSSYGVWHVFNRNTQRMLLWAINIAIPVPIYPLVGMHLTPLEKLYGISSVVAIAIGGFIYGNRICDIFPKYFGYHEIFHSFTLYVAYAMFMVYYLLSMDIDMRCQYHDGKVGTKIHWIATRLFSEDRICTSQE
jgi:hemolysin III